MDADWSLNAGNWMWLSASAFFHQYFRVYSPIAFGKKTDKGGSYIKYVHYSPKKIMFMYFYVENIDVCVEKGYRQKTNKQKQTVNL